MTTTEFPKVYVGTYRKYNNGSLKGGYVNLATCKDYGEFLDRCKKLHPDEKDPEFMIQDHENLPDGLACMEWIGEADFNDILKEYHNSERFTIVDYSDKAIAVIGDTKEIKDQLKALGGRFNFRLTCGAGWIFPKSKLSEIEKLLKCGSVEPAAEKERNPYKDALNECLRNGYDSYNAKHSIGALKLDKDYYLIEKPAIENRFCFPDEGPGYENYKYVTSTDDTLKKYFLSQNLGKFTHQIEKIENLKGKSVYLFKSYDNTLYFNILADWENHESGRKATDEEIKQLTKALSFGKAEFEKRLNTYLKKYGVSKLNTWTYWVDR